MGEFMEAALARTREEVPEPRDLPNGTWRFKSTNAKYYPEKDDASAYIQIVLIPTAAQDDVDTNELEGFDMEVTRVFHRAWMADARDEWAFWELVAKFGIKHSGRTLADILPEFAKGYEVMATAEQKFAKDGERIMVNLKPNTFSKA